MKRVKPQILFVFLIELVSTACLAASPVNLDQLYGCIYDYWGRRLRGDVVESEKNVALARSAFRPSLNVNITTEHDFIADPPMDAPASGGNIILTQQIYNLAQKISIESKVHSEKAASFDFEDQLLGLMKTAAATYYQYASLKTQEDVLIKRQERLDKAINLAKELNRLNLTDKSAALLAQSEKVQLDISLLKIKSDMQNLISQIKAAVGVAPAAAFELDPDFEPPASRDIAFWNKTVDELPSISALKAKIDAAKLESISASAEALPTVALSGLYGEATGVVGSVRPSLALIGTVTLPLFDQGSRDIRRQSASSQKSVFEAQVASKHLQLISEVQSLISQLEFDEKALTLAQDQVNLSLEGYNSVVTLYSLGKTNFISLKDSESTLISAELQVQTLKKQIAEKKALLDLYASYTSGRRAKDKTTKSVCGGK